ncbi:PREDICTED: uncharacterized protein LOC104768062 [Camelina sativa]|uniref:ATP-dependent DNA helicase n=1 Tax=Camelina sativa TaxID=90675 RepID=A0ABM0XSD2_CAMSA|nr:PREDICTED: uncharacterized protein LOC104768062 [Camelina sativa]
MTKHYLWAGYEDDGDPDYSCSHCGALFWYGERVRRTRKTNNPVYIGCCMQGQIVLPMLKESPEMLWNLLTNEDDLSRHFQENTRPYNMLFSFTSLGGRVDRSVKKGRGPSMFALQGENYHLMGSLKPKPGDYAKFQQLYIVDTQNEVNNSLNVMSKEDRRNNVDGKKKFRPDLVESFIKLLDDVNPHVQAFRMARDRFDIEKEESNFHMRIISNRKTDGREYNIPTASEVAALIPGDIDASMDKRDIVLQKRSGKLLRIHECHVAYLALQYPLLFPRGDDGYRLGIKKTKITRGSKSNKQTKNKDSKKKSQKDVSMRQWFAYRLQERKNEKHTLLRSMRLLQQFIVEAYTMIETNRLRFFEKNQKKLRRTYKEDLRKAAEDGDDNLSNHGDSLILPASFTGGPRYMRQSYLDAMATCKKFGFPDLFITFTCNPKWPELVRFVNERKLKAEDRPDIICKIFKLKLENLMDDITRRHIFGKTVSAMYTVEFQKRGLPHAHIIVWMDSKCKFPTADEIDKLISAEIPDKDRDQELYNIISECMIHGPCDSANPSSPFMEEGSCTKFYPKQHVNTTSIDKEGYPVYRRRKDGRFIEKNGFKCDNRYVVPYNRTLSLKYHAHINVEWCNQTGSVKYVSACEAMWRILAYPIHYRQTAVVPLTFHEEGKQPIYYREGEFAQNVMDHDSLDEYQFLALFELNKRDEEARKLLYEEIPSKFIWDGNEKEFYRRKTRAVAIGRINYVPPTIDDAYHLRILLNSKRGPTSFDHIKTVNGVIHKTYREACYALGLLDDDKEYIEAVLSTPHTVWEETWELTMTDEERKIWCLHEINKQLKRNGSSLKAFKTLPQLQNENLPILNQLIADERRFINQTDLQSNHLKWLNMLTEKQKKIYDEIIDGVFFLYGFGGTGKTFLWRVLSAAVRIMGEIVLNTAYSGISSLLLEGGRTAHSRFGIPLDVHETPMCHMSRSYDLSELVQEAKLIIWDEAPMMSKYCFETLDRSLKDIMRDPEDKPFGGKVIIFGGDFQQILPVIVGAGREQIVNSSLNSSSLWNHCKVLRLTRNMRLLQNISPNEARQIEEFSKRILDVGEGRLNEPNDGVVDTDIPEEFLITEVNSPIESIINAIYGNWLHSAKDASYFQNRAILCPTNDDVSTINDQMLSILEGDERVYLSSDSIDPADKRSKDNPAYSPDFLNSVRISGVPNHALCLKIGCPVMLLRNIDAHGGLMNGTRLQITQMADHVLQARIITGTRVGKIVLLPRMVLIPSDT